MEYSFARTTGTCWLLCKKRTSSTGISTKEKWQMDLHPVERPRYICFAYASSLEAATNQKHNSAGKYDLLQRIEQGHDEPGMKWGMTTY